MDTGQGTLGQCIEHTAAGSLQLTVHGREQATVHVHTRAACGCTARARGAGAQENALGVQEDTLGVQEDTLGVQEHILGVQEDARMPAQYVATVRAQPICTQNKASRVTERPLAPDAPTRPGPPCGPTRPTAAQMRGQAGLRDGPAQRATQRTRKRREARRDIGYRRAGGSLACSRPGYRIRGKTRSRPGSARRSTPSRQTHTHAAAVASGTHTTTLD
jgi:hypothetical protein